MPQPDVEPALRTEPTDAGPAAFAGVVAMDGPSGTGKSTVSRLLAKRLGARHLDTGAMYRAATLAVLNAGVDPASAEPVTAVVARAVIDVSTDPASPSVTLSGVPVDAAIRSDNVTKAVSAVSAVPAVRTQLVARQRQIIESDGGIVVEGRDIGTVVWPQAELVVFLTASPEARARRRAGGRAGADEVAVVAADIERRDRLDSTRTDSPLRQADGAVVVDTTGLGIEAVVDRLAALVESATAR